MLEHTKKPLTESIQFYGTRTAISRLRKYARTTGAVEANDSILATTVSPEIVTNPHGTYLKGIRYRDELTQNQLADATGIARRHLSEMENGKRTIGKENAKKLAAVLHVDYRMFL
ncbi:MAG: helix-turn-helix transcriptional regulator [Deltaproteobacteria bacterium]